LHYYIHDDALRGANVLSNASGTVAEVIEYYSFGGIIARDMQRAGAGLRSLAEPVVDTRRILPSLCLPWLASPTACRPSPQGYSRRLAV
jgi:hypothetical protein